MGVAHLCGLARALPKITRLRVNKRLDANSVVVAEEGEVPPGLQGDLDGSRIVTISPLASAGWTRHHTGRCSAEPRREVKWWTSGRRRFT